jgi:nicotinate-nucleotide adenylyltransferase
MKYGILGGTFNPIHNGHLSIARDVKVALHLDKIVFVPAKIPPLKLEAPLFKPETRIKLVKAATAEIPYSMVSEVDYQRHGPSYSVNTLPDIATELKSSPKDLFFILGVDAFLDIKKWYQFERLFQLANFVIVTRSGYEDKLGEIITIAEEVGFSYTKEVVSAKVFSGTKEGVAHQPITKISPTSGSLPNRDERSFAQNKDSSELPETISKKITPAELLKKIRYFKQQGDNNSSRRESLPQMIGIFSNNSGFNLFIIEVTPINVSSTEIRSRIGAKKSILGMVPDVVVNLIKEESIA